MPGIHPERLAVRIVGYVYHFLVVEADLGIFANDSRLVGLALPVDAVVGARVSDFIAVVAFRGRIRTLPVHMVLSVHVQHLGLERVVSPPVLYPELPA